MKNKNRRELEKYWAEQATKKAKAAKKQIPPKPESDQPAAESTSGKKK